MMLGKHRKINESVMDALQNGSLISIENQIMDIVFVHNEEKPDSSWFSLMGGREVLIQDMYKELKDRKSEFVVYGPDDVVLGRFWWREL